MNLSIFMFNALVRLCLVMRHVFVNLSTFVITDLRTNSDALHYKQFHASQMLLRLIYSRCSYPATYGYNKICLICYHQQRKIAFMS